MKSCGAEQISLRMGTGGPRSAHHFFYAQCATMQTLFSACVALTFVATLFLCVRGNWEGETFDRLVLVACAGIQIGLLLGCVPGEATHIAFITTLTYAALLGGTCILRLASALLTVTLALRLACGGCLFNTVEKNGQVERKNWSDDAQLLGLLMLALVRLRCGGVRLSTAPRAIGLACVAGYNIWKWDFS